MALLEGIRLTQQMDGQNSGEGGVLLILEALEKGQCSEFGNEDGRDNFEIMEHIKGTGYIVSDLAANWQVKKLEKMVCTYHFPFIALKLCTKARELDLH